MKGGRACLLEMRQATLSLYAFQSKPSFSNSRVRRSVDSRAAL